MIIIISAISFLNGSDVSEKSTGVNAEPAEQNQWTEMETIFGWNRLRRNNGKSVRMEVEVAMIKVRLKSILLSNCRNRRL